MSAPLILGTNSIKDTGYNVDNSVRLDGTDDHFSRTLTQAGTSNKAFTFSCWIKRSKRNTDVPRLLHMGGSGGSPTHYISVRFRDDQNGRLSFYTEANGGGFQLNTNALFRDESAWMHIVVAVNSAATEEIDRQKMYVNGVQITSFSSTTAMSYNADLGFNDSGDVIYLFRKQEDSDHFPGYACEVAFIDGQQLTPTSFGEFDSDTPSIWKPIDFKNDVTFGTNGFYLEFKDSSDLGADTSGNGNDLNYNFGAVNQSTDTCTNNFATLNPLKIIGSSTTISEGNLRFDCDNSSQGHAISTFAVSSGKWYWEYKQVASGGTYPWCGIMNIVNPTLAATINGNTYYGSSVDSWGFNNSGGVIHNAGYVISNGTYSSLSNNDIVGVAVDLDNSKLYFSVNGTFQGSSDPAAGTNGISITSDLTYAFGVSSITSGQHHLNFGSPIDTISSGNADANGHGNFEYSVPSGYFAICSKNLAEFG